MALAAINTMGAIRKKVHNMKLLKDSAGDILEGLEARLFEHKAVGEKNEEELLNLNKRVFQVQNDQMVAQQLLAEGVQKLNRANKQLAQMESEMLNLSKKVRGMEEEYESVENKLLSTTTKLEEASKAAEESERGIKVLEARIQMDEERIVQVEGELEVVILFGEEADRKYEETARKLAITEVDLSRSESRVHVAELRVIELEEEFNVVSNNMKSLEIFQIEAQSRFENYEMIVVSLTHQLKETEARAADAERLINVLQKEIDKLEDELAGEKDKFRLVASELDFTINEITAF